MVATDALSRLRRWHGLSEIVRLFTPIVCLQTTVFADPRASWILPKGGAVEAACRVAITNSCGIGWSTLMPSKPELDQATSPKAPKPFQWSVTLLLPSSWATYRQQPRRDKSANTLRASPTLVIILASGRMRKRNSSGFSIDNTSAPRFFRASQRPALGYFGVRR